MTGFFTPGPTPGAATLSALAEGGLTAETTLLLAEPQGADIILAATPIDLNSANQSALTVTVRDVYGAPVAGETVRLSINDGSGQQGTIADSDGMEEATNKDGHMKATFDKKAGAKGAVIVRAEPVDSSGKVMRWTTVILYLSGPPAGGNVIYMPFVRH